MSSVLYPYPTHFASDFRSQDMAYVPATLGYCLQVHEVTTALRAGSCSLGLTGPR